MQMIKSNNGTEYTSKKFNKFYEDTGVEHQLTAPYSPQQNGTAERKNWTIMEMDRCLLHDKELPKKFWAEAENEDVDDEPVRGTRLLSDIYQRCNVAVMEPSHWSKVWVYRTKFNLDGSVNKYKARLVVKGYAQMFGDRRNKVVVSTRCTKRLAYTSIEEIFMEQPKGFAFQGQEDKVNEDIPYIFVTGDIKERIDKFKKEMENVFEITDLGKMTFFLRMQVQQKKNEIFVCQEKYAKEVLMKFNTEECKSAGTPMNQKEKFCTEDGAEKVDEKAANARNCDKDSCHALNAHNEDSFAFSQWSKHLLWMIRSSIVIFFLVLIFDKFREFATSPSSYATCRFVRLVLSIRPSCSFGLDSKVCVVGLVYSIDRASSRKIKLLASSMSSYLTAQAST
ncbi:hypothetical protein V8G54_036397 [Vigna mungo]|uniref:Integrase catalytic domain-containing protein n=1 Tax=Vigna mungo TaxID=3915 RepID=A0AAQ3RFF2_VIGMU